MEYTLGLWVFLFMTIISIVCIIVVLGQDLWKCLSFDRMIKLRYWRGMYNADHYTHTVSAYSQANNTTITIDSKGGAIIYGERVVNTNYKRFLYPHQLYYSWKYKKLYYGIKSLESLSTRKTVVFSITKKHEIVYNIMNHMPIEKSFKFLI